MCYPGGPGEPIAKCCIFLASIKNPSGLYLFLGTDPGLTGKYPAERKRPVSGSECVIGQDELKRNAVAECIASRYVSD
jgi:hypothetical protein